MITDTYGTIVRAVGGIIGSQTLLWIGAGILGMMCGMAVGERIYKKLNQESLKKCVYLLVGLSGVFKICEFFLEVFLVRIIIIAILINNTFESIAINKTMS